MKIKIILIYLIIFGSNNLYSENTNKMDLNQIFNLLDNCITDTIKNYIRKTDENFFREEWRPSREFFFAWNDAISFFDCINIIDTLIYSEKQYKELKSKYMSEFSVPLKNIIWGQYYKHLKKIPLTFDNELDTFKLMITEYDKRSIEWLYNDTINGNYIPKDIDDAYNCFINIFSKERLADFFNNPNEEKAVINEHFGFGLAIRNMWKLGGSRLSTEFYRYKITIHDEISSLLLTYFYRKANKKDTLIRELIKEYQLRAIIDKRQSDSELLMRLYQNKK